MFNWLLDIVFPIQCLGCGAWDSWLCASCETALYKPRCIKALQPPISSVLALNSYSNSTVQRSIQALKYDHISLLGKQFGELLATVIHSVPNKHYDWVIPVPLHVRRARERGFNQSAVIAQQCNLPYMDALIRNRYTTPQANLNRTERLMNLVDVFSVKTHLIERIRNSNILLVDDVYTTGTTLATCARVLKNYGAKQIDAAVIAIDYYQPQQPH